MRYTNPRLLYFTLLLTEPIIGPLKSKMAEISHLENRHDVNFILQRVVDLDKIFQTGAE